MFASFSFAPFKNREKRLSLFFFATLTFMFAKKVQSIS